MCCDLTSSLSSKANHLMTEIDHNTGVYVFYSLRILSGFISANRFQMSKLRFMRRGLPFFQVQLFPDFTTKATALPQLFKEPQYWSSQDFTPPPPSQQNVAHSVNLIGRRLNLPRPLSGAAIENFLLHFSLQGDHLRYIGTTPQHPDEATNFVLSLQWFKLVVSTT